MGPQAYNIEDLRELIDLEKVEKDFHELARKITSGEIIGTGHNVNTGFNEMAKMLGLTTQEIKAQYKDIFHFVKDFGKSDRVHFNNIVGEYLDQDKVDAEIAQSQNQMSAENIAAFEKLWHNLNQGGGAMQYEKGFGGDNIYRSDHGNYKFELDITNLGANAGKLLQGLTIGNNEDGSIGDLTGISYSADEGWFNKITGESFTSFMEAQRSALEQSTAYQVAKINEILQPLVTQSNIEREAAGMDQILDSFETFDEISQFLEGMNALDGITANTLGDLIDQLLAQQDTEKEQELIDANEGQTDAIVDGAEQAKSIGDTTVENIQKQLELSGTSNELSQEQMALNQQQNELTTQQNELTQKILSLDEGDTVKMAELVSIMDEIKEQQETIRITTRIIRKTK